MIEPNGSAGFASGTASGIRTRRYHSLLLADAGRLVLVNGFDAQVEFDGPGRSRPLVFRVGGAAGTIAETIVSLRDQELRRGITSFERRRRCSF